MQKYKLELHGATTPSDSASPSSPSQRRSFLHSSPSAERTLAAAPGTPESADGSVTPPPRERTPDGHERHGPARNHSALCVCVFVCVNGTSSGSVSGVLSVWNDRDDPSESTDASSS